jgi:nucleotide-binding universal stress UspA family protein
MPFKHLLVPTDFGDASLRAADLAVDMARAYQASLTLVHTCELPTYTYPGMAMSGTDLLTALEEAARRQLEQELERVRGSFPAAKAVLRTGVAWEEILATIDSVQADLVVMGTHGRRGVRHLLLGSVAEKIVRTSRVPVLTVRANA